MKTFEDYLKTIHAKDYRGTDDDMPDAYLHWLSYLDSSEIIEFAEEFVKKLQEPIGEKWGINEGHEMNGGNDL